MAEGKKGLKIDAGFVRPGRLTKPDEVAALRADEQEETLVLEEALAEKQVKEATPEKKSEVATAATEGKSTADEQETARRIAFLKKYVKHPDINEVIAEGNEDHLGRMHNTGNIQGSELEAFLERYYTEWYNGFSAALLNPNSSKYAQYKNFADKVKSDPKYKPEAIKKAEGGFMRFFADQVFDTDFMRGARIGSFQGMGDAPEFVHIMPNLNGSRKTATLRLYLNLKKENILPFAEALVAKGKQKDFKSLYFKFATTDGRADNFVIYTNYADAEILLDMIEEVKKEKPALFAGTGAEKLPANCGVIKDYIGFGEEPIYKHSSFNSERDPIIGEIKTAYLRAHEKKVVRDLVRSLDFDGKDKDILPQILKLFKAESIKNLQAYNDLKHIKTFQDAVAFCKKQGLAEPKNYEDLKAFYATPESDAFARAYYIPQWKKTLEDMTYSYIGSEAAYEVVNRVLFKKYPEAEKACDVYRDAFKFSDLTAEDIARIFGAHDVSVNNFSINQSTEDLIRAYAQANGLDVSDILNQISFSGKLQPILEAKKQPASRAATGSKAKKVTTGDAGQTAAAAGTKISIVKADLAYQMGSDGKPACEILQVYFDRGGEKPELRNISLFAPSATEVVSDVSLVQASTEEGSAVKFPFLEVLYKNPTTNEEIYRYFTLDGEYLGEDRERDKVVKTIPFWEGPVPNMAEIEAAVKTTRRAKPAGGKTISMPHRNHNDGEYVTENSMPKPSVRLSAFCLAETREYKALEEDATVTNMFGKPEVHVAISSNAPEHMVAAYDRTTGLPVEGQKATRANHLNERYEYAFKLMASKIARGEIPDAGQLPVWARVLRYGVLLSQYQPECSNLLQSNYAKGLLQGIRIAAQRDGATDLLAGLIEDTDTLVGHDAHLNAGLPPYGSAPNAAAPKGNAFAGMAGGI